MKYAIELIDKRLIALDNIKKYGEKHGNSTMLISIDQLRLEFKQLLTAKQILINHEGF